VAAVSVQQIEHAVREMLANDLRLGAETATRLSADTPLLGEGLGLDSIDALNLVTAIEQRFGIEIGDDDLTVELFKSLNTLTGRVAQMISERSGD